MLLPVEAKRLINTFTLQPEFLMKRTVQGTKPYLSTHTKHYFLPFKSLSVLVANTNYKPVKKQETDLLSYLRSCHKTWSTIPCTLILKSHHMVLIQLSMVTINIRLL